MGARPLLGDRQEGVRSAAGQAEAQAMTVAGLDSSTPPTASQAQQAAAAGVQVWGGYPPTGGEANGWSEADFLIVRQAGMEPIAFYFGVADIQQVIAFCRTAGVRLVCFDEEGWTGGAHDSADLSEVRAAGGLYAGLYGHPAAVHQYDGQYDFAVAADYSTAPGDTWPENSPVPAVPHGRQYQGTHPEFGLGVDRGLS